MENNFNSSILTADDISMETKNFLLMHPKDVFALDLNNPKILFYVMINIRDKFVRVKYSEDEYTRLFDLFNSKLEDENIKQGVVNEMVRYSLLSSDTTNSLERFFKNSKEANKDLNDMSSAIAMIIDELLKEQKVEFSDIRQCGEGAYSSVYQIGKRILKLGKRRKQYEIPNSDKILQPIARKEMKGFGFELFIEITNRVELIDKEDDEDVEQLYKLWKELRDEGIIWTDPSYKNVGILLSDNVQKLDGEDIDIDIDPETVGFKGKINKIRRKGELVVIDTDYLYRENDPTIKKIKIARTGNFIRFINRYNKEKMNTGNFNR